ncbi:MAG TPA: vanadium-dependent haloperoxidase [Mycobacteriales bacterium]
MKSRVRSGTVVLTWNEAVLAAIRATRPAPPVAARALAVVHTAMYDAWAVYQERAVGTRLGLVPAPADRERAARSEAVGYAAYHALLDLFPDRRPELDATMAAVGLDPGEPATGFGTASGIGAEAARAVLEFRHGDGANQLGTLAPGAYADWTGYRPVNTPDQIVVPDRWQPLRVPDGRGGSTVQRFAAPHWGLVTPFSSPPALPDPVPPPAPAGSARFREQAEELVAISARLSSRQKAIAQYWADGPNSELPPGHWCLFAGFVSRRDRHDLDADVVLFFMLANALHDAGIETWHIKRRYDYVRPITAIRELFAGRRIRAWAGPGRDGELIDGGQWQPYQEATVVTPPFAEYPSGHSTFSAAAAEVLRRFTGSDAFGATATVPAGSSRIEPGLVPAEDLTLGWDTFSAAADQAGLSRRYGGIHFEQGDLVGRAIGRAVGARVWRLAMRYLDGAGPHHRSSENGG